MSDWKELKQRLVEYSVDARAFCEGAVKIEDYDTAEPVAFKLREAQVTLDGAIEAQLRKRGYCRLIVLKCRKWGATTYCQVRQLRDAILGRNLLCVEVANDQATSDDIFEKTMDVFDRLPDWLRPKLRERDNKGGRVRIAESDSRFRVWTAGNFRASLGRGRQIHRLHGSEVFHWPEETVKRTFNAIMNAMPKRGKGTVVVLEGTANGSGTFMHKLWKAAEDGRAGDFETLFVPWTAIAEYEDAVDRKRKETWGDAVAMWRLGERGAAAKLLKGLGLMLEDVETATRYGWGLGRALWRRRVIDSDCAGDVDLFRQEYPTTAEEAFLASGGGVLAPSFCDTLAAGCRKGTPYSVDHETGEVTEGESPYKDETLHVWEAPEDRGLYTIGVDTALGLGGDLTAFEVLRRDTGEQVAELAGQVDPLTAVALLEAIGYWYNTALVGVEVEGPAGMAVLAPLIERRYPMLYHRRQFDAVARDMADVVGWSTNAGTRGLMTSGVLSALRQGTVTVRSLKLVEELRGLQYSDRKRIEAGAGETNDDRFMAFAIALRIHLALGEVSHWQKVVETAKAPESRVQAWSRRARRGRPEGSTAASFWRATDAVDARSGGPV